MKDILLGSRNILMFLGRFIQEHVFTNEQKGDEIFPLIDDYFIRLFCDYYSITINDFILAIQKVRINNINAYSSIEEILGFIGIQLYAASKMESANGYSAANYRDRICSIELLNIELVEWQTWVRDNQDAIWRRYYNWCESNGFIIVNKCFPKFGKDRYVQYPKVHANLILNREDLKSIANLFVEEGLSPHEDIQEKDFWKIIKYNHFHSYYSLRAQNILKENRRMANKQIYQYYLTWDGKFMEYYRTKKLKEYNNQLYLHFSDREIKLEIIENSSRRLKYQVLLSALGKSQIHEYYRFKREDIILFKKYVYGDYWIETRFLDDCDDEGIAVIGVNVNLKYSEKDVIKRFPQHLLLRVSSENQLFKDFYSSKRPYTLLGGIKLTNSSYLLGFLPLIKLETPVDFWIDGIRISCNQTIYHLNLGIGRHNIKFKGYKGFDIVIENMPLEIVFWGDSTWNVQNRRNSFIWGQQSAKNGIVGLDFSCSSLDVNNNLKLKQWCKRIFFGNNINDNKSIV